jgi:hypothetical protein
MREIYRLSDHYKIISISRPILARANMGLDFVSGQYGCLFSRCRKYLINSLIHGHFHIGLVIIPRPPYWPETESRTNMGRGMIIGPIWKCPCIKLFIKYFRHLKKRHPYWKWSCSNPIIYRLCYQQQYLWVIIDVVFRRYSIDHRNLKHVHLICWEHT